MARGNLCPAAFAGIKNSPEYLLWATAHLSPSVFLHENSSRSLFSPMYRIAVSKSANHVEGAQARPRIKPKVIISSKARREILRREM